ncbi:TPA: hypothetical protein EYP26_03880 [Candidatus Bathyarchaeota archaeon]|nr:hypothetical protein [Candidatus Bathyarchaeota archaeon]
MTIIEPTYGGLGCVVETAAGAGLLQRRLKGNFEAKDILLLISISPILAVLAFDFNSFILGWNEGRGGLLFAIFFLLVEWRDSRGSLKPRLSKGRVLGWVSSLALLAGYFIAVYGFDLQGAISRYGETFLAKGGLLSWTWLWEYVVFALALSGFLLSIFGLKALKGSVTPLLYCVGSALILLLDAFFPHQSPGALGLIVPVIVGLVSSFLWVSGVKFLRNPLDASNPPWVYVKGNVLYLGGLKGFVILEINWPCAGVLSMLIYSLVIIVLMVKLDAPLKRKLVYAGFGALGTFLANVFRIFLITLAAAYSRIDLRIFHESIGEALFVVWIAIYLLSVLKVEGFLAGREAAAR